MKKEELKFILDKIDLINDRLSLVKPDNKKGNHILLKAIISAIALSFFGWAGEFLYRMPSPTQQKITQKAEVQKFSHESHQYPRL